MRQLLRTIVVFFRCLHSFKKVVNNKLFYIANGIQVHMQTFRLNLMPSKIWKINCVDSVYRFISCLVVLKTCYLEQTQLLSYSAQTYTFHSFPSVSLSVCLPFSHCVHLSIYFTQLHIHIFFSFNICSSPQLFAICCLKQSSFCSPLFVLSSW